MERIIIFLIRKRLGLKKYQRFYLKNQADKTDRYYFTEYDLQKETVWCGYKVSHQSNIRLNFLLSDRIKKLMVKE